MSFSASLVNLSGTLQAERDNVLYAYCKAAASTGKFDPANLYPVDFLLS